MTWARAARPTQPAWGSELKWPASTLASTPSFSPDASAFSRYLVQGKTRTGNHVAMETREALPDTGENKHVLVGLNPSKARVASPPRLRDLAFLYKCPGASPPRAFGTMGSVSLCPLKVLCGQGHPGAEGGSHCFCPDLRSPQSPSQPRASC